MSLPAVTYFSREISCRNASTASCAAWPEAAGKPPIFSTTASLLIAAASTSDLSLASSVTRDPQAIAGTQPLALNRISTIFPPRTMAESSRMSPHAGFSSLTRTSALASSPGLRGCSK